MKKIVVILLSLCSLQAVAQKNSKAKPTKKIANKIDEAKPVGLPFEIKGKLEGCQATWIAFAPFLNQAKMDTLKVVNNEFVYKGNIAEPTAMVYLREDGQSNIIFVDPGPHDVIIDCGGKKGFGITADPSQENYNLFNTTINPLIENRAKYQNSADEESVKLRDANEQEIQKVFKAYIANPASAPLPVSFLVFNTISSMQGASEAQMMELYNLMPKAAQESACGKQALKTVARQFADEMGKIAPDFTLLDSAGKKVSLSDYRNKNYVLVDFWATWCGPCRNEFPALMDAQKKYASKGLVILGVSIDADKKKWKDMLAKPGFTNWVHVWDGPQGPNQIVQTIYNAPSIPRNFLIDKNGKVIARNLRGAQVEKMLQELIK